MIDKVKENLYNIIFGTDTRLGKIFDLALILLILFSVFLVILESVPTIGIKYAKTFYVIEWLVTLLFTLEYLVRIWVVNRPFRYIFSFFGFVDLLAIMPTYLSLFLTETHSLTIIRAIRVLRIFRVLKIPNYYRESLELARALKASIPKITVFIGVILIIASISGAMMYLIEGPKNGFVSIPSGIYWAIVTMTTVGFGDIVPLTVTGKIFSSVLMVLGYGIIAVPTGIVTAHISRNALDRSLKQCHACKSMNHLREAKYCHQCGAQLPLH